MDKRKETATQIMYIAACTTIQSSLQSHVNTPHGAQYGRRVPLLNSHGDSLSEMVVREGLLGGFHDALSEVLDETVGFLGHMHQGSPLLRAQSGDWAPDGCPGK